MDTTDVQVGSTITNGSSALRVTERVLKDPRWRVAGWRGLCVSLEEFGGNTGSSAFVPDYLLGSWHHVPFEWAPVTGGALEERYVWSAGCRYLQREVRRIRIEGAKPTQVIYDEVPKYRDQVLHLMNEPREPVEWWADCTPEHGVGHPDCPKCWHQSERNPNRRES
jgi:hypothetical protein